MLLQALTYFPDELKYLERAVIFKLYQKMPGQNYSDPAKIDT